MSELDVVLSKINIIKNCLYAIEKANAELKDEFFLMSVLELNLQRAIQATIDLAQIVISKEGLGLPNTYKQSFQILNQNQIIDSKLTQTLASMVGFRNISVHDYSEINPEIVKKITHEHLSDFEKFYTLVYERAKNWK